jgi:hypothetical protein
MEQSVMPGSISQHLPQKQHGTAFRACAVYCLQMHFRELFGEAVTPVALSGCTNMSGHPGCHLETSHWPALEHQSSRPRAGRPTPTHSRRAVPACSSLLAGELQACGGRVLETSGRLT